MAIETNNDKILKKIKEIVSIEGKGENHYQILSDVFKIIVDNPNLSSEKIAENCKKMIGEKK